MNKIWLEPVDSWKELQHTQQLCLWWPDFDWAQGILLILLPSLWPMLSSLSDLYTVPSKKGTKYNFKKWIEIQRHSKMQKEKRKKSKEKRKLWMLARQNLVWLIWKMFKKLGNLKVLQTERTIGLCYPWWYTSSAKKHPFSNIFFF